MVKFDSVAKMKNSVNLGRIKWELVQQISKRGVRRGLKIIKEDGEGLTITGG